MHIKRSSESGQIALAILLIMGVVLVISLSVANRTTQDIAQTVETSSAARVFSQAESGTEQQLNAVLTALQAGDPVVTNTAIQLAGEDAVANTTVTEETTLIQTLAAGDTAQVVLDTDGDYTTSEYGGSNIKIGWTNTDSSNPASLIISEYYWDPSNVMKVRYSFVELCDAPDTRGDGFLTISYCGDPSEPLYSFSISNSVGNKSYIVRVQAVYNSTTLTVTGDGGEVLPAQQFLIRTEAVSNNPDIQQNAAIEVTTSRLLPPPFLDYALYSGAGSITK